MKIYLFINRNVRNEMVCIFYVIDISIVCDRIIGFRFRRVNEFIDDG